MICNFVNNAPWEDFYIFCLKILILLENLKCVQSLTHLHSHSCHKCLSSGIQGIFFSQPRASPCTTHHPSPQAPGESYMGEFHKCSVTKKTKHLQKTGQGREGSYNTGCYTRGGGVGPRRQSDTPESWSRHAPPRNAFGSLFFWSQPFMVRLHTTYYQNSLCPLPNQSNPVQSNQSSISPICPAS